MQNLPLRRSIGLVPLLAVAAWLFWLPKIDAAEPDFSSELPRIPPHAPADALGTIQVLPGFRVEQVAAEPLVTDPVAMEFDAQGRLYVAEMVDYSEDDKANLGLVRLLEDVDEDGRFDRSSIFVEGLSWPTAITCYDGGVFIGAAPDIWYAKDTDGDGRADEKRIVFTGFGRGNVQGLFNSFRWGLDNRIHGGTSTSGGQIICQDRPQDPPLVINGRDFAFDPVTMRMEPDTGSSQHGMSYDDWGRKYLCGNSDHIQTVMYDDRYAARNPHFTPLPPKVSIAADGPQAEVFRISPVEPWRIVRTRLRVSGQVPGPIEGGGRAAGYFTGATGTTIYRGDAWPVEYRGQSFTGDVGSNIVHRKVIDASGLEPIARRVDEQKEFLASTDNWFRPAQFANAPDGNLYVLDVYREVIEHPASLPPVIKKHLDLTSGRGMGRIYRIVPEGYRQRPLPKLQNMSAAELVKTLDHANGWHRDAAARVLCERYRAGAEAATGASEVVPLLRHAAANHSTGQGRLHALYVLHRWNAAATADILARLKDPVPQVRIHAARLAERLAGSPEGEQVAAALAAAAEDESLHVRFQAAFSLGEFRQHPATTAALVKLARQDGGDRWMRTAILSSLHQGAAEVFQQLVAPSAAERSPAVQAFLPDLITMLGARHQKEELLLVVQALRKQKASDRALAFAWMRALGDGTARAGVGLRDSLAKTGVQEAVTLLDELLAEARHSAASAEEPLERRLAAVQTLKLDQFAPTQELLTALLDHRQPQDLQLAALITLDKIGDDQAGPVVLNAWRGFSPRVRAAATEVVFARMGRVVALLDAVEKGELDPTDVDPTRVKLLLAHNDAAIKERSGKLFSAVKLARRQEVVDAYQQSLTLPADIERGRTHFRKVCAACHKVEGQGHEIGPNLAAIHNRGAEFVLLNVLDPNREVNPQFINYVALTGDGRNVTGMIAAETAATVTLRRAESVSDTLPRAEIETLESTRLSLMPEGMEKQLDQQALADVIAYLMSLR